MSISKLVQISRLYPSDIEDLAKPFRDVTEVSKPYGMSRGESTERYIQALVDEVEVGLDVRDPERRNGPYFRDLDARIDDVNKATTVLTDDPAKQVPEELRFVQLALFEAPEVDGRRFSYGIMIHYGSSANPLEKTELAVLLPYEKDDASALVLSNNHRAKESKTLRLIVKALEYARHRTSD
ncbi:hypothetical protein HN419_03705 [Candidatus Woesearchaeota archaeon]|jgi:hypothetical protein|nr:hypothetical protein [Candidatus Woesearchaeota archaeon]MBT3538016.1 hypothetical protein [Candidatus Woesearchaeota archaeon]MBT4698107.1 hypothetical protein [Candidatus Woesearchaeota archaeon]MBT4717091.1 hypothetical protein [Candidatus Woesearchaeota archaeon]MBT7105685.1 hypothetical protein [Candidatus Woesearchaeota archaeon]